MNDYEQLIEMMFTDGTLDQSVRQEIEGMNDLQKRLHIVKILDKGLGLFTKIEGIMNLGKMDYIKNILMMLKSYVLIADVENKKFGEVMTPLTLIKDMLNTLPEEVWSNPELKWLDPANGTGPYPIMVIYKLMVGLKDWEPDDEKRYKHIVENMIYVGELQPKNMFLYMNAVDPMNECNLNAYTGSFLEKEFDNHMRNMWSVEKFDIVVGNPPYSTTDSEVTSQGTTGNFIWDKFVIKSIELLKEKGLLLFVHPPGWRRPPSDKSKNKNLWETMSKRQIKYLEIHNASDGLIVFNAGTRYDFYVLENTKIYEKTTIKDEDGLISQVDIRDWLFLPNKMFDVSYNIMKRKSDKGCDIIYNRSNYGADRPHVSREKSDVYRYEIVHSTPKKGNRFVYSSLNNRGHFGISKVIFGESGIGDVIIDMDGVYGMSQGAMAIKVSSIEEAENIKKSLMSKKFNDFLKSVMWSNFRIEWKLFCYLKHDFWKTFID
jgi:hypothetical protein